MRSYLTPEKSKYGGNIRMWFIMQLSTADGYKDDKINAVAIQKLALRQNQKENVFHIYAFTFNTKLPTGT